jgi:hypothetical protein
VVSVGYDFVVDSDAAGMKTSLRLENLWQQSLLVLLKKTGWLLSEGDGRNSDSGEHGEGKDIDIMS